LAGGSEGKAHGGVLPKHRGFAQAYASPGVSSMAARPRRMVMT
jgi:hypothetical protein